MVCLEKDGTVGRAIYMKDDDMSISPGEAEVLLNANSKSKWGEGELSTDRTAVVWYAEDGTTAAYSVDDKILTIYNAADGEIVDAVHEANASDL